MEKPTYYGILPADVRYSNMSDKAKLIYSELTALTDKYGYCFASNRYFASLYNTADETISRYIKELKDNGFIGCEYLEDNTRRIYLLTKLSIPIDKNINTPIDENVKHNNTSNNNKTIINRGVFTPPTLNEVIEYCKERNNGIDAESFIDFYESKGWLIGKNKMKDWKAAIRTWEKRSKNDIDTRYKEARIKEIEHKTKNNLQKIAEMSNRADKITNLRALIGGKNDTRTSKCIDSNNKGLLSDKENA